CPTRYRCGSDVTVAPWRRNQTSGASCVGIGSSDSSDNCGKGLVAVKKRKRAPAFARALRYIGPATQLSSRLRLLPAIKPAEHLGKFVLRYLDGRERRFLHVENLAADV